MADEVRLLVSGTAEELTRFAGSIGRRSGMRVGSAGTSAIIDIASSRIERLGPKVEAASVACGVELYIADLQAKIMSAGLDGPPSWVWSAIAIAADERAAAIERGMEPIRGLFDYIRVALTHDGPVALDGRPSFDRLPRVWPSDMGTVKLDDADWHQGAAAEAGQPEENASTHMRLYLTWLIRHDLIGRGWVKPDEARAVKAGAVAGRTLLRSMDDKLVSDAMVNGGAEFSTDTYKAYLTAYNEIFAAEPDYSTACDATAYERVAPVIDALWMDWLARRQGR